MNDETKERLADLARVEVRKLVRVMDTPYNDPAVCVSRGFSTLYDALVKAYEMGKEEK